MSNIYHCTLVDQIPSVEAAAGNIVMLFNITSTAANKGCFYYKCYANFTSSGLTADGLDVILSNTSDFYWLLDNQINLRHSSAFVNLAPNAYIDITHPADTLNTRLPHVLAYGTSYSTETQKTIRFDWTKLEKYLISSSVNMNNVNMSDNTAITLRNEEIKKIFYQTLGGPSVGTQPSPPSQNDYYLSHAVSTDGTQMVLSDNDQTLYFYTKTAGAWAFVNTVFVGQGGTHLWDYYDIGINTNVCVVLVGLRVQVLEFSGGVWVQTTDIKPAIDTFIGWTARATIVRVLTNGNILVGLKYAPQQSEADYINYWAKVIKSGGNWTVVSYTLSNKTYLPSNHKYNATDIVLFSAKADYGISLSDISTFNPAIPSTSYIANMTSEKAMGQFYEGSYNTTFSCISWSSRYSKLFKFNSTGVDFSVDYSNVLSCTWSYVYTDVSGYLHKYTSGTCEPGDLIIGATLIPFNNEIWHCTYNSTTLLDIVPIQKLSTVITEDDTSGLTPVGARVDFYSINGTVRFFRHEKYSTDFVHGNATIEVVLQHVTVTRRFFSFAINDTTPASTSIVYSIVRADGTMWIFSGATVTQIFDPSQGQTKASFEAGILLQPFFFPHFNILVHMTTTDTTVSPTFSSFVYIRESLTGPKYEISKTFNQKVEISLLNSTTTRFKNVSVEAIDLHPIVHTFG